MRDQAILLFIVLHDLGKIGESFREQIKGVAARAEYHSQLSFMLLQHHDRLLEQLVGGSLGARRALYAAVAGHHGGPPELDDGSGVPECRWMNAIGGQAVEAAAVTIESVGKLFPEALLEELTVSNAKVLSWKIFGLTIQAAWIGSNTKWFRCQPADIPVMRYWAEARRRAQAAIAAAGLHHAEIRTNAVVLPQEVKPRPMQQAVQRIDLPKGPTLVMIEDMTSGKDWGECSLSVTPVPSLA